jgi:hypothetical protein
LKQYIQRAIALREDLKTKIWLTGAPVEFTDRVGDIVMGYYAIARTMLLA